MNKYCISAHIPAHMSVCAHHGMRLYICWHAFLHTYSQKFLHVYSLRARLHERPGRTRSTRGLDIFRTPSMGWSRRMNPHPRCRQPTRRSRRCRSGARRLKLVSPHQTAFNASRGFQGNEICAGPSARALFTEAVPLRCLIQDSLRALC